MSRRRSPSAIGGWKWKRFRVVCSCVEPPVIVREYRALADPADRQAQLDIAREPGAYSRLRVLHSASGAPTEYGLEDPHTANGHRNKPIEWRCQKCHRNVSPTALQADEVADHRLALGESCVDIFRLTGNIPFQ